MFYLLYTREQYDADMAKQAIIAGLLILTAFVSALIYTARDIRSLEKEVDSGCSEN